jgi:serine/threonine protein phosphatase 1
VHGRFDLPEKLLKMIVVDAQAASCGDNVLVFLGDYVDHGPDSRRVVERLTMPAPKGFEIVCLKGNYEEMLMQFLDGEGSMMIWLKKWRQGNLTKLWCGYDRPV